METASGKIEKVYENKTNAGKKYVKIMIDGATYSCWETTLFDKLQEGMLVSFSYEQNKGFNNIMKILTPAQQEEFIGEEVVEEPVKESKDKIFRRKDEQMMRMNALKCAVEFYKIQAELAVLQGNKELKVEKLDVYNLAEQFRQYNETGGMFK